MKPVTDTQKPAVKNYPVQKQKKECEGCGDSSPNSIYCKSCDYQSCKDCACSCNQEE